MKVSCLPIWKQVEIIAPSVKSFLMKTSVKLGLKENWKQFKLLVIINAFVGGMVGLERTIIQQIAEAEFALAAKTEII